MAYLLAAVGGSIAVIVGILGVHGSVLGRPRSPRQHTREAWKQATL